MGVEKPPDELWIGVKGQSNFVIAGSLRNIFRYSVVFEAVRGRALIGLGPTPRYQTQSNSEYSRWIHGSQALGDKIKGRKGNSPDYQLRSPSST